MKQCRHGKDYKDMLYVKVKKIEFISILSSEENIIVIPLLTVNCIGNCTTFVLSIL